MILDANDYRLRTDYIKSLTVDKDSDERYDFISILSIATGIPVIIVVYYLMELYGEEERLFARANSLKKFYNITDLRNVKEKT